MFPFSGGIFIRNDQVCDLKFAIPVSKLVAHSFYSFLVLSMVPF
jgi:hypothetical protein